MPPLPSLSDVKLYIGLTTTTDDALLTSLMPQAISAVEHDTGRSIASGSNSTTTYSTDGNATLVIHDRPRVDATRTVSWLGVTMTEGTNVWFLPDRRDENVVTTIQLRFYDTGTADWYKTDPQWFDKNLDSRAYGRGAPNDLVISGIKGMPFPSADIVWAVTYQTASMYFLAKSGASGTVYTPTGEPISVDGESLRYQKFIAEWKIHTAVASVG